MEMTARTMNSMMFAAPACAEASSYAVMGAIIMASIIIFGIIIGVVSLSVAVVSVVLVSVVSVVSVIMKKVNNAERELA